MQNAYKRWIHAPSLRGRLIWLCVSSVLVTLLVSLLVLVLLISNVMEPFVNREVEFAMQAVSRSLSTKVQLLEDTLLRTCKWPPMLRKPGARRSRASLIFTRIKILSYLGCLLWKWHISLI